MNWKHAKDSREWSGSEVCVGVLLHCVMCYHRLKKGQLPDVLTFQHTVAVFMSLVMTLISELVLFIVQGSYRSGKVLESGLSHGTANSGCDKFF